MTAATFIWNNLKFLIFLIMSKEKWCVSPASLVHHYHTYINIRRPLFRFTYSYNYSMRRHLIQISLPRYEYDSISFEAGDYLLYLRADLTASVLPFDVDCLVADSGNKAFKFLPCHQTFAAEGIGIMWRANVAQHYHTPTFLVCMHAPRVPYCVKMCGLGKYNLLPVST